MLRTPRPPGQSHQSTGPEVYLYPKWPSATAGASENLFQKYVSLFPDRSFDLTPGFLSRATVFDNSIRIQRNAHPTLRSIEAGSIPCQDGRPGYWLLPFYRPRDGLRATTAFEAWS